jgi:hypothetical protein
MDHNYGVRGRTQKRAPKYLDETLRIHGTPEKYLPGILSYTPPRIMEYQ